MQSGFLLHAQELQILLPNQYEGKANAKELEYKETFYVYKASVSPVIQLKQFKQYYPELALPDTLRIELPDLSHAKDTTLLLGVLQEEVTAPAHLVLLLATDYTTNEVTFYVDSNMDGNYNNDEAPILVQAGKTPLDINLYPMDEKPLQFSLGIPKRTSIGEKNQELLKELRRKSKMKIRNKLTLGVHAGVGVGRLTYEYDNLDIAYPTWYTVRFTERALGLNLDYEATKFRVGVNATLNNHFYYTSYLNVQFAEPRGLKTGILTERNIDTHALNRLQVGGSVAYKIPLTAYLEVQPIFSAGQLFYLSDNYFSDNRPNKEIAYALSPDFFYEVGVRIDVTVGQEKALFLDLVNNTLKWRPNNFLEGINFSSLAISHRTWKINLGYKISL